MSVEPQHANKRRDNASEDRSVLKKVNKSQRGADPGRAGQENGSRDAGDHPAVIAEANAAARKSERGRVPRKE